MANGQEQSGLEKLRGALSSDGRDLLDAYTSIASPTSQQWETLVAELTNSINNPAFPPSTVQSILTNSGYPIPSFSDQDRIPRAPQIGDSTNRTDWSPGDSVATRTDPYSFRYVQEDDRALGPGQTRRRMRLEDPFAAFTETVLGNIPQYAQAPQVVQQAARAPYRQLLPQYLIGGAFGPEQYQNMPFGDFLSSGFRPTAQGMTHGMGQLFNLLTGNTPWAGQPGQVRSVARTLAQDPNLVFDTALTPFYQQHGPMMGNALLSQLKDMYSNWQSSDIGRGLDYGTEGQQALAFLQGQDLPFLRNVLPGAMGQYFNVAAPETPR
jgi:hypothetical protein